MSPQSNDGRKGFEAGEALDRALRVKLSSATIVKTGAGEEGIGTTTQSADSGQLDVNVRLDGWSVEATASGNITEQGDCYAAASGKMSATISGRRQGIALESASDGEIFEMMVAGVNS